MTALSCCYLEKWRQHFSCDPDHLICVSLALQSVGASLAGKYKEQNKFGTARAGRSFAFCRGNKPHVLAIKAKTPVLQAHQGFSYKGSHQPGVSKRQIVLSPLLPRDCKAHSVCRSATMPLQPNQTLQYPGPSDSLTPRRLLVGSG